MRRILGLSLLAIGIVGLALGQNNGNNQGGNNNNQGGGRHTAPEINPGQAISALALLSGGLLIVRRKK
jgi:hypothetical protein